MNRSDALAMTRESPGNYGNLRPVRVCPLAKRLAGEIGQVERSISEHQINAVLEWFTSAPQLQIGKEPLGPAQEHFFLCLT